MGVVADAATKLLGIAPETKPFAGTEVPPAILQVGDRQPNNVLKSVPIGERQIIEKPFVQKSQRRVILNYVGNPLSTIAALKGNPELRARLLIENAMWHLAKKDQGFDLLLRRVMEDLDIKYKPQDWNATAKNFVSTTMAEQMFKLCDAEALKSKALLLPEIQLDDENSGQAG